MSTLPIILDTDIGTDVDDLLALAFLWGSPEVDIKGITCAYGDTELRARIIHKLFHLANKTPIPVCVGAKRTLLNRKPIFWEGHEGQNILSPDDPPAPTHFPDAVDFLIQQVKESQQPIHLVAIAPLTNIALACIREPDFPKWVRGMSLMGGVNRPPDRLELPVAEHNILCDPDAAQIVFRAFSEAKTPVTVVPLDVTTQVRLYPSAVKEFRACHTLFHDLIADEVEDYSWYQQHGSTALHDPLTAASLIDPNLLTTLPVEVNIELTGTHTLGASVFKTDPESQIRLAIAVRNTRAQNLIVERILDSVNL